MIGKIVLFARVDAGKRLTIWDATNRVLLQTLEDEQEFFENEPVALSPDGTLLAWYRLGCKTVKLWDIATGHCKSELQLTLDSDRYWPIYLHFSDIGSQLHFVGEKDDGGPLTASVAAPTKPLIIPGYGVQKGDPWIKKDGKNVLWLPPDYRTHVFATKGSSMALGCDTGQVLFLRFA